MRRNISHDCAIESAVQRYGQLGHVQLGRFDYLWSGTVTPEQPWLSTSLLGNLGPLVSAAAFVAVAAGRVVAAVPDGPA